MALTTPIIGQTSVIVNSTTTLTNATPLGTWSSTDISIATIDSVTGVVTTLAVGVCSIIYTVSTDSIATTFTVTSSLPVTNGFNITNLLPALQNRVLWESQGIVSDSQRYYEDVHPLNDTAILNAIRPQNGTSLTTYLASKQRSVIMECLNAVFNAPQIIDPAQLCFVRSDVMLYTQPVTNNNQFVGIKMLMAQGDYSVMYNSLELFFNSDVTFTMYLYNDMSLPPIYTKVVSARANEQVIIDLKEDVIQAYLTSTNKGGIRYFGYYQADLGGAKAFYYPIANQHFHPIYMWAYSAPVTTDSQGNRNFQRNNIGANNLTYGLNIEVSTYVDATNNIQRNSHLFDELFGLKMAEKVVKDIIFNYRSNNVQILLGAKAELSQLYRELNGQNADDQLPYIMGLKSTIAREVKRVKAAFQEYKTTNVGIS
jgi:hypothetical protein